jgi:hypothetical protein
LTPRGRVKKRDVTGQLNFLFWEFNDLHVWKLPNFNQKFIIKEIFIQLCKLFMVSLDFERILSKYLHMTSQFFPRQSIGNLFFYETSMENIHVVHAFDGYPWIIRKP